MKRVLVYGSGGALGRATTEALRAKGWNTIIGVELGPTDALFEKTKGLDFLIQLPSSLKSLGSQIDVCKRQLKIIADRLSASDPLLKAVICTAGGFRAGGISSPDFVETFDLMQQQNVYPPVVSAALAKEYAGDGHLVLIGSHSALGATSWGLAYGMCKSATHHLARSLSQELKSKLFVTCLLPKTLDTPSNRQSMAGADMKGWTPCEHVANYIESLISSQSSASRGVLVSVITEEKHGEKHTQFVAE